MRAFPWAAILLLCVITAPAALAQTRDRAGERSASPPSDLATLAKGWTALAAGRHDEAARTADTVLQRRPWDRAAIILKISALSAAAPTRALDAYERWVMPRRPDDPGLLEPIAIGVLEEIAKSSDSDLRRRAMTALSEGHVAGAREALDALPARAEELLLRDVEALRTSDAAALKRIGREASTPETRNAPLARALAGAGAAGEPALLTLLNSTDSETRAAAARSLGALKSDSGRVPLQRLLQDSDPLVRTAAAVSLARMGDPAALATMDRMLASGVPDVQLAAAEAWEGRNGPWVSVIRPLLENADGLTRVQAAHAIAPVDPEAARKTLGEAMADPNPVMRAEAAQAMSAVVEAQPETADLAALRQRLRDRDPLVRLVTARLLLRLARV